MKEVSIGGFFCYSTYVPQKLKIIVAVAALLVVISGLLLVYDPVKGVPLSLWYGPKVTNSFNRDFNDINPRLANDYGIYFDDHNRQKDCGPTAGYPSSGKAIFTCSITVRANPVVANEAFIKQWQKSSLDLEQYLLEKGWQKEWNKAQPIDEILNNFTNDTSIGVNYVKRHGKITCRLSFSWLMPQTPNQLTIDEVCELSQRTWGW